ncbi:MAG: DNA polymerase IV [Parvularculaceae bacterium]|nr:DNA polymerase IV [Parvularculaceae bacterium]
MAETVDLALCLDCGARRSEGAPSPCAACGGRRIIRHPELDRLSVAHVDCDAFYAAIEKRDDPALADRPVIVGGGVRGVVTTACYVARTYGVKSAMPMFKALRACPDAVVIKPNFPKYAAAGRDVRRLMETLTPLVEPVSIDEAFLDLSGTRRVHQMSPAEALAGLQRTIRREIGITVSIGLSFNKFLAKTASDFDKPNGFSVIGVEEAERVLAPLPVSAIFGVGAVLARRLNADGLRSIGDLQRIERSVLIKRYGDTGLRLSDLSHGRDHRRVSANRKTKSVSVETTFSADLKGGKELEDIMWRLCDRASSRMKAKRVVGRVVTLKLKTSDFRTITRQVTLPRASNLARTMFEAARPLLAENAVGCAFRLIGVSYSELSASEENPQPDMFHGEEEKQRSEEGAIDEIRRKFGDDAIALGRDYARKRRGGSPATDGDADEPS